MTTRAMYVPIESLISREDLLKAKDPIPLTPEGNKEFEAQARAARPFGFDANEVYGAFTWHQVKLARCVGAGIADEGKSVSILLESPDHDVRATLERKCAKRVARSMREYVSVTKAAIGGFLETDPTARPVREAGRAVTLLAVTNVQTFHLEQVGLRAAALYLPNWAEMELLHVVLRNEEFPFFEATLRTVIESQERAEKVAAMAALAGAPNDPPLLEP